MSEYYKLQWEKELSKHRELFERAIAEAELQGYKKAIQVLRDLNTHEAKVSANHLETKYEETFE
jgi:hypothetical protein